MLQSARSDDYHAWRRVVGSDIVLELLASETADIFRGT